MKKTLLVVALIALLPPAQLPARGQGERGRASITVLTNRTDIVDTDFVGYRERFTELYPNVEVNFEAITDYQGQVQIRLNTTRYGDVLLIPDVDTADLPDFFEPLGTLEELDAEYLFANDHAYEGVVYGLPVGVNADGVLYNRRIFEEAGVPSVPSSPEEFLEAMRLIRDNTDAIPYYTNYAAGWALDQWEGNRIGVSGDPDYLNRMVHMDDPFSPGRPHYVMYRLMYDLVAEGLTEEDPTTTDWESSKIWIGEGRIAAMVLGSWAISQAKNAAIQNGFDPDDVAYMPFPNTIDGEIYASSGRDYAIAVNVHSEHKEEALAWLWFFLNESGFARDQGMIPPRRGSDLPETLRGFQELGVNFISGNPAPDDEVGLLDAIDDEAEIGLGSPDLKQRIIEAALGNRDGTFDEIMEDLDEKWAEARAAVMESWGN
jgi:raffinose/stachyose/melibiose transport system substrate-binding protein